MAGGKYFSVTGGSKKPLYLKKARVSTRKVSDPVKTYVRKAINSNIETKQYIASQFAYSIDYDVSPFVEDMTNIAQGDTEQTRDGNVIKPYRLDIRYQLNGSSGDVCRIMVIQWKQDTAVVSPTINIAISNNVFNSAVGSGTEYISPVDIDRKPYFNVLYDRMIPLDSGAGLTKTGIIRITKMMGIHYNDSATTGKNHLFILATSDTNNASTPPFFTYVSNFLYKDI